MTPSLDSAARLVEAQRLESPANSVAWREASERWLAPLAVIEAREGFGEANWLPAIPASWIAVRIRGAAVEQCLGRHDVPRSTDAAPSLTLQPTGTANRYRATGPITFAQIYLPDRLLDRAAEQLGWSQPVSGRLRDDLIFFHDPELMSHVAEYLRHGAPDGGPATELELEARTLLIVERLLTGFHAPAPRASPPPRRPVLPAWKLKRVVARMEAGSGADLRLGELAADAGLSPFHFARAFRNATGTPPHRYLMALRLERACRLLEASRRPVTAIASDVGFADPAYFARAFRRAFCATPTEWRRLHGGGR